MTPHLHAEEASALNLPQKELSFPDFLSVLGSDLGIEHLENLLLEEPNDIVSDYSQKMLSNTPDLPFEKAGLFKKLLVFTQSKFHSSQESATTASFTSCISGRAPPFYA